MNEKQFLDELSNLGIELNEVQIKQFRMYSEFLLDYNKKTNLTAIKTVEDVYLKHFYDSLLLCKFRKLDSERVLDIGSGAGFPGVPLKIVFPNIDLTLLDSNNKKTKFLEELRKELNISFTVINDRAEKYILREREAFDIVTARAVTAMPVLAELCIPFARINGEFIAYKGNMDEDFENGRYAIEELGAEVSKFVKAELPVDDAIRSFLFASKKCKTDNKYPRPFDRINKKPLQK